MLTITQQLTERLGKAIQKIQNSNIPEDYSATVTAAADRLGLSIRQRCMMAASVANTSADLLQLTWQEEREL